MHHRTTATALALTAALGLLAGCGSDGEEADNAQPSSSSSSPSPSSSSADPEQEAKDAALRAYEGFGREQVKAYTKGSTKGTKVAEYASGDAYVELEQDVRDLHSQGVHMEGKPKHDAEVVSYTPKKKGSLPLATISDCMDISKWKTVEEGGKSVPHPSEQPLQYVTTVKAEDWGEKGGDEGWMIVEFKTSTKEC